jgi:Icc-related predicted phosphoesterase
LPGLIWVDPGGRFATVAAVMKMLFVADLHYALKQFDWLLGNAARYDAVIIGGDLLDLSSPLDLDVQIVIVGKYLTRLSGQTRVLVSSGNHDGDSRSAADESICQWLREARNGQLYVDGDSVDFNGTLVTICPWWDGPVSRAELAQLLEQEAGRTKDRWIWIHHAPPDRSPVSWSGKKFSGDEFLVGWIERYQPDLVLCGHIHNAPYYPDGSWIDRLGRTWVFNPGRQIGPNPAYLVFDLDKMSVQWVSLEGEYIRELAVPPAAGPGAVAAPAGS